MQSARHGIYAVGLPGYPYSLIGEVKARSLNENVNFCLSLCVLACSSVSAFLCFCLSGRSYVLDYCLIPFVLIQFFPGVITVHFVFAPSND